MSFHFPTWWPVIPAAVSGFFARHIAPAAANLFRAVVARVSKGVHLLTFNPVPALETAAKDVAAIPSIIPWVTKALGIGKDIFTGDVAAVTKDLEDPAIASLAAEALVWIAKEAESTLFAFMASKFSPIPNTPDQAPPKAPAPIPKVEGQ